MSFTPLLIGTAATAAAAVQLAAWIAVGSVLTRRRLPVLLETLVALLIGAGISSFALAVLAAVGWVRAAVWFPIVCGPLIIVLRRSDLQWIWGGLTSAFSEMWRRNRFQQALILITGTLLWLNAIAPPRDADAMSYHLAHVRTIDLAERWTPVADVPYSLPFGWTLNYLPFEHFGLAQSAHLLNLGLFVLVVAFLFTTLTANTEQFAAFALLGAVFLQPFVFKAASTAHADMYLITVTAALVGMLLWRGHHHGPTHYWLLLGFIAFIGLQSRYQAGAITAAATFSLAIKRGRMRPSASAFGASLGGAAAALFLSAPFYVMNVIGLRNAVWPFATDILGGPSAYANRVADAFVATVQGHSGLSSVPAALKDLVFDAEVFPLPVLTILLVVASLVTRDKRISTAALFVITYVALWAFTWPAGQHRYLIAIAPALVLGLGFIGTGAPGSRKWLPAVSRVLAVVGMGWLLFSGWYSFDAARYVVTGDQARYHRYTWFYDVYRWIGNHTAPDKRFLVVVSNGHTYYLERDYLRADPFLSGAWNWLSFTSPDELIDQMHDRNFDYLIYQDRDWTGLVGGGRMENLVKEAIASRALTIEKSFDIRLSTLRIARDFVETDVMILQPRRDK